MFKVVSSIGNAAYKTATKAGLAAGSDQPPYACSLPLQVIESDADVQHIEGLLDPIWHGVKDLLGEAKQLQAVAPDPSKHASWKMVDYEDPDGDLILFTRPHMGPYNFAKATMSFVNVHPETVLSIMHAQSLEARQRYSANLSEYAVLQRNPALVSEGLGNDNAALPDLARRGIRNWYIEYNKYHAPPPVASREFLLLIEKRYVVEDDTYYIYGCTVDYKPFQKKTQCVRGSIMFGWELAPVGGTTMATYVSCINPNGWTPTFLVGWMKTEIGRELTTSRRLLYEEVASKESCDVRKDKSVIEQCEANSTMAAATRAMIADEMVMVEEAAAAHRGRLCMKSEDQRVLSDDEFLPM